MYLNILTETSSFLDLIHIGKNLSSVSAYFSMSFMRQRVSVKGRGGMKEMQRPTMENSLFILIRWWGELFYFKFNKELGGYFEIYPYPTPQIISLHFSLQNHTDLKLVSYIFSQIYCKMLF